MSTYKMESNSLANLCKKIIFENINLRKKQAIPEGLSERTLHNMTKDIKEKLKNEGSNFTLLLKLLGISSYYFDDICRSSIFILAEEKENRELLKKDRKLRNKLIEEEIKAKKYLFKNDFDHQKGFLEFLQELNKSMFFKLSKNYENENENEKFCRDSTWPNHVKKVQHMVWPCTCVRKVWLFSSLT